MVREPNFLAVRHTMRSESALPERFPMFSILTAKNRSQSKSSKFRTLSIVTALFASLLAIPSAHAAAEARVVTGVSAFYRVDIGYMVGWTTPTPNSGIVSYTVTANPGGVQCVAKGPLTQQCVFTQKQLGYSGTYIFTVVVNSAQGNGPTSSPSNPIRHASIPTAPQPPIAKVMSDSQIDITWVPSPSDGGAPLYGYQVNVWESQPNTDPGAVAYKNVETKTFTSVTGLKPSTMYIINVASCNAYGCNSADLWTYVSTTGPLGLSKIRAPRVISGGNASTTCWDAIIDAGNAASTGVTVTKSATKCALPIIDPTLYPKINPTATSKNLPNLPTKFKQNAMFLGLAKSYSMTSWKNGIPWFAYFQASSKSATLGFEIAPVLTTTTPNVCAVQGSWITFAAPGECVVNGSVPGDNSWAPSNLAVTKFSVTA